MTMPGIGTTVPQTRQTAMRCWVEVLRIIKGKAEEMDMVPFNDVIEEAKADGIDEDKVRDFIAKLEKKGEIYKPRHGFLRPTNR